MKRLPALLCILLLFTGCARAQSGMDRAIAARESLLNASGCTFEAEVTADYGDKTYTFTMDCEADNAGNVRFFVTQPETIAGIGGRLGGEGGSLTFDGSVLAFPLMADGVLSPVGAPWAMLRALRGGYLTDCAEQSGGCRVTIDDSFSGESLRVEVLTGADDLPLTAEILWEGRRILSVCVRNFALL